jgi:hypothetical protein
MTLTHPAPATKIGRARTLRQRLILDRLDYEREIAQLAQEMSQTELARQLAVTQPAIQQTLKKAAKLTPVREGFAGASPYEIAQRYAVGEIGRDRVIDELARWEYVPQGHSDGYDSLIVDPPGTFEEVIRAADDGLIDGTIYDEILTRCEVLAG